MERIKLLHSAPADPMQPAVARQVKSIAHAYLFHSLIGGTQYTTADPPRTAANPRCPPGTDERDCRGLRTILIEVS